MFTDAPRRVSPEALDDDPPLDTAAMAELTRKRARRAMLEGCVREAQSWTRLYETWRRLAADEAEATRRAALAAETPEQEFARIAERRAHSDKVHALLRDDEEPRAAEADAHPQQDLDEVHDLHEVHEVHATSETEWAGPPLDKRRRRQALARLEAYKARQACRGPPS